MLLPPILLKTVFICQKVPGLDAPAPRTKPAESCNSAGFVLEIFLYIQDFVSQCVGGGYTIRSIACCNTERERNVFFR